MSFLEKYYPIVLAILSFFYSIYLWFTGNQLEGIYVGLWPITILGFAIAIRQRRRDALNKDSDAKIIRLILRFQGKPSTSRPAFLAL